MLTDQLQKLISIYIHCSALKSIVTYNNLESGWNVLKKYWLDPENQLITA